MIVISQEESRLCGFSVVTGIVSWIILNRNPIRGDRAACIVIAAFLTTYCALVYRDFQDALKLSTLLFTVYTCSLATTVVTYRLSPLHPLSSFSGPKFWSASSIYLAVVSAKGRRHHVLADLHRRYGKFVRIGPNHLSISSPHAGHVIYTGANALSKGPTYTMPGHIDAVALFFKVPKEAHSNRKRIWAQALTGNGLSQFYGVIEKRTHELVSYIQRRQDKDGVVDFTECLDHWSYDLMGDMVFGGYNELELMKNGDPDRLIEGGRMATAAAEIFGQAPWLMDIAWHLPASKHIHELRHLAARMMRRRIAAASNEKVGMGFRDLSSYLISEEPGNGRAIPARDLEIDAAIAIVAGSDPIAIAMIFIIYFLLRHPKCYAKLQSDLDQAFPDQEQLTKNKLTTLPYLTAVIDEGLRLTTPFFLQREVPVSGAVIDGVAVPGGTIVAVDSHSQQLSEENFGPDADAFHPERWLPGGLGTDAPLNRQAFTPFSTGRYACSGKMFAMHVMRMAVARLIMSFDMAFPENYDQDAFLGRVRVVRATFLDQPLLVKVQLKAAAK
ncbi:cytochrome P450 [Neolentinus lepideus HHB14362 ss-1]|uniref:Cytochrome P450 n=1 Tax=Neolentinus lepideus HHB14362 ss-1 TaxID=1314782 RepID=A0A165RQA8_9AGAM|nr:cytochrome P450 [Neolentinus lepideus HHB14362 ss-1]